MNRRKFLKNSVGLASSASLIGISDAFGGSLLPPSDYLTFDLHCHPGFFFAKGVEGYSVDAGINKTLSEMITGKLSGAFFSLVADAKTIKIGPEGVKPARNFESNEAWSDYKRQMGVVKDLLRNNEALSIATRGKELQDDFNSKRIAGFISCEGGDFLEGDAGRLEEMFQDGVRSLQLVHYHPNELGDLQTDTAQHNGLSAKGKEVVKRMNKLGMLIDVAHATFETTKAVADLTSDPIILSHGILTIDSPHPLVKRTISKEHAKLVAKTGGVIGAWPCGLNKSFDDFLDNTLKLIEVVGVDHVGLGTDMDANFKPVLNSYLQMPQWIEGLKSKGLKDEDVRKVVGGNVKRVLEKVF